uniref:Uncharacterized protein n=1 Tax=Fagus sylvatica TaxID=28930 RepID=A0A2N9HXI2_FAGSY
MGTAVLMEKLGLNLTVHDITYVYSLQMTGRDQYTLVAGNSDRKLVTGLPDSSKGRDEDFLVITGNWQNPHISCPLVPDKEFTAKKIEFVERRAVEHLLKRPCFIDSGGRPRAASILLEYEPSYKSFQKGPIVKNFGQAEVTVARPGRSQEEIIQAVPVTARKGVQVPQLVTPLIEPNFVPSLESSEVGEPVIRFPSLFDPNSFSQTGTCLFKVPPPPGFSQGEDVMRRKRKRGEEENDEDEGGQELPLTEPLKKKPPSKKGKSKSARALQKAADERDSVLKSGSVRGGKVADAVGKALLLLEDMKVWQEKRSKHMLENLKRDSVLTERHLNQSHEEIKRLKDFEKSASARIRVAESAHKSAKAGLMNMKRQVTELREKLDREYATSSRLRVENSGLKDAERDGEETAEDSTVLEPCEVMNEPELAVDPEMAEDPGYLETDDRIPTVEVQEGEDDSDGEENIDVVD